MKNVVSSEVVTKSRRGRPAFAKDESTAIVLSVNIDGRIITWSDGMWAGDKFLIAEAEYKSEARVSIPLIYDGVPVEANEGHVLGALAAMIAINPGRAKIIDAPSGIDLVSGSMSLDTSGNPNIDAKAIEDSHVSES